MDELLLDGLISVMSESGLTDVERTGNWVQGEFSAPWLDTPARFIMHPGVLPGYARICLLPVLRGAGAADFAVALELNLQHAPGKLGLAGHTDICWLDYVPMDCLLNLNAARCVVRGALRLARDWAQALLSQRLSAVGLPSSALEPLLAELLGPSGHSAHEQLENTAAPSLF